MYVCIVHSCCPCSQRVTESTHVDESMYGGNASAEGGADEGAEDASQSGCNIVLANRLQETTYSKKDYQTHIKVYTGVAMLSAAYCPLQYNTGQPIHICKCTRFENSPAYQVEMLALFCFALVCIGELMVSRAALVAQVVEHHTRMCEMWVRIVPECSF